MPKNFVIKHYLIITFITCVISSCGTGTKHDINISGQWHLDGLPKSQINTLLNSHTTIFAGTDNGVFKNTFVSNSNNWSYIGLGTDSTKVVDIIAWSVQEMMVAIQYENYSPENKILYKTNDGGNNWISYNKNFTDEKNINNFLRRLALDHSLPNRIFALGGLPVARSTDRGQSWKAVYKTWKLTAFGQFLKIDPRHPNIIWSGGSTNIYTTHLVKSTDGGDTWQLLSINGNGTVYDLIINPSNSNHVMAGLNMGIRKSTEGGQNWSTVFTKAEIYSFTHSARDPQVSYASGRNKDSTLFFAASRDFGDHWQTVTMPDSPNGMQVNDMVSVMQDGHEVLYLGTNKGVYSYTFEK